MPQILDNALGAVGNTPLIRLDNIKRELGLKCNLRKFSHLWVYRAVLHATPDLVTSITCTHDRLSQWAK